MTHAIGSIRGTRNAQISRPKNGGTAAPVFSGVGCSLARWLGDATVGNASKAATIDVESPHGAATITPERQ